MTSSSALPPAAVSGSPCGAVEDWSGTGWVDRGDGRFVPVVDGLAFFDRCVPGPLEALPDGVALERHALDMACDAMRLCTRDDDDLPAPTVGAVLALLDEVVWRGLEELCVLGGAGLVGELVAAARPRVRVTTILGRKGPLPSPTVAHALLRAGERAANHRVAYAVAEEPLPFDDGAFAAVVIGSADVPAAWRDDAVRLLGTDGSLLDVARLPSGHRAPRSVGPEQRVLGRGVSATALVSGRAADPGGEPRPLTDVDVEILYFGARGRTLGEIADAADRDPATVVAAALALVRDELAWLVDTTPAAARLHHRLATGELLPTPADTRPDVLWRRAVAAHGDRPALILHDGFELSYVQADVVVRRFWQILVDLDVRPGDRIGVLARSSLELFALFWAAMHRGVGFATIPMDTTAPGLEALIERLDLRVCFVDQALPTVADVAAFGSVVEVFEPTLQATEELRALVARPADDGPVTSSVPRPPGATASVVAMTSGTTGASKAVVMGGAGLVRSTLPREYAFQWAPTERALSSQYPSNVTELRFCFLSTACSAAASIVGVVPQPGHVFNFWALGEQLGANRVRLSAAVALQLDRETAAERLATLPALGAIETGGTHLRREVRSALATRLGCRMFYHYGATEAGSIACQLWAADHEGEPTPRTFDHVVQLRRPDGSLADADELADIWILHDRMMDGYLTPDGLDRSVLRGAWYAPPDVVRRAPGGYLEVVGRRDDIFSTATGQLVVPSGIESLLASQDLVNAAAIVPGSDSAGGIQIVAFLECLDPATDRTAVALASKRLCRERLGEGFVPFAIHVVDALPRNAAGKITRNDLRARASA
ncbi:MAG: class I adenylate-forming enzyme family protein [Pseudomonadota bacterium]